jgi:hypothetical protein
MPERWGSGGPNRLVLGRKEIVMSGTTVTRATLEQRIRGLIAGTQKHSPNGSLTFDGATYTAAALVQLLQGLRDTLGATDTAKASWQDALKDESEERAKLVSVIQAYRAWLLATYGNAPSTLADYGMTPRKARTPLTAEQKVAAAAKAKATREARHTMGSKQKKGVKGTMPAAVPTTPPAASPPVVAPPRVP